MPMIVAPPVPVLAVQDAEPAVKPFVEIAEWLEPVRTMLAGKFGADKMDRVNALLQETGAIIAGGSILRAVSPWNADVRGLQRNLPGMSPEVNDLDIYVPVRMTPRLIDGLYTGEGAIVDAINYKVLPASSYCESFLRKNGIRRIHTFTERLERNPTDIMSVRHRRSVQQVVTNFDLTICQIWYDGAHVYASHPQDIRDKRTTLQSDYVLSLMRGNQYIRRRLDKYMKRGFSISIAGMADNFELLPTDRYACAKDKNRFRVRKTKPEFWNRWFASVATAWLSGSAASFRNKKSYLPSIADNMVPSENILIPLAENLPHLSHINATGIRLITKGFTVWNPMPTVSFWNNFKDTGYDSEDYENVENRQALAAEYMSKSVPGVEWQADGERAFALAMNKFLEYQMLPIKYDNKPENRGNRNEGVKIYEGFTFGTLLYKSKGDLVINRDDYGLRSLFMQPEVFNIYLGYLVKNSLRTAAATTDFANEGALIYDIHNHPLAVGISKVKLKDHLRRHKKFPKDAIPCYWRECNKTLALTEIHHILGREDYGEWFGGVEAIPMWKGFAQSDVTLMDTIFSEEGMEAKNFSCCPVCLSWVRREDGCMFMHHKCPELQTPYSVELYNKYKDDFDNLWWCTLCGRVCQEHRRENHPEDIVPAHHALGPEAGPRTDLIRPGAGASPFSNDCTAYGGGMLLEKFIRFQKIREVANILKAQIGRITLEEAKKYMIKQVWDSPLNVDPMLKAHLQTLLTEKRFNIPTAAFPNRPVEPPENNLVYPNVPYPNGAGADPLLPIVHEEGDDVTSMERVRPAIQFVHRRQNGEVNLHADEYIGLESLFNLLQSRNDEYRQGRGGDIGMCWNYPTCNAKIHPQEIAAILTRIDTNPDITAENKARYRQIYDVYRNNYNRINQRGGARTRKGGRRQRQAKQYGGEGEGEVTPFFVEATDAACMLPRRENATVASRKRKTLKKKRFSRHR